jgi:3-deoxy-D-manno-octulosonate 8-phosphate phosphatase (KDO 8-P phosphatase)
MKIKDKSATKRAGRIKLLILDVDGVMTDGRIIIDDRGRESKFFDVRDGHGIKLLTTSGIEVALVTGRKSDVVKIRARELGIRHLYQGAVKKADVCKKILEDLSLCPDEAAFVGDDLIDIPAMKIVGLSVAVADSIKEVADIAHVVTEKGGGRGAVREVCEFILKAKGLWDVVTDKYMK